MIIHRTTSEAVKALDDSIHFKGEAVDLIELEPGDLVLTKEEKEALAKEIAHHYVSYDNTIARSVIRKLID